MKVRDLVKDTVWRPGRDYEAARPLISVLLPTFRRASNGSFLKSAASILQQSLRDIELIVIDDGSTDGTAQQIATLMAADARVSCLTHPANIGLPAISEYEAFVRARGDYISFGFDDFIFHRDALAGLAAFPLTSARAVVHGYVRWFDREGNERFYGRDDIPHDRLRFFNFLANAGFLVPRAILQDVGLFDPHIAAARLCDWDLWRRILKKYPIHRAPVYVGTEYGHTRDDSLENTYPLFEEALQEYFSFERDELLRPDNFPNFDVWTMPRQPSAVLSAHILRARRFFASRCWAGGLPFPPEDAAALLEPERRTIAIFGDFKTPMDSIFQSLSEQERQDLLYIHPDLTDAQLAYYLAGCGAVIMACRRFDARVDQVSAMCAAIGVPVYDPTDVNSIVTAAEIIARTRPVDAVDWIVRLRKMLEHSSHRAVRAEARAEQIGTELHDRSIRLAAAEVQLASRSYRLALKLRSVATAIRRLARRQ